MPNLTGYESPTGLPGLDMDEETAAFFGDALNAAPSAAPQGFSVAPPPQQAPAPAPAPAPAQARQQPAAQSKTTVNPKQELEDIIATPVELLAKKRSISKEQAQALRAQAIAQRSLELAGKVEQAKTASLLFKTQHEPKKAPAQRWDGGSEFGGFTLPAYQGLRGLGPTPGRRTVSSGMGIVPRYDAAGGVNRVTAQNAGVMGRAADARAADPTRAKAAMDYTTWLAGASLDEIAATDRVSKEEAAKRKMQATVNLQQQRDMEARNAPNPQVVAPNEARQRMGAAAVDEVNQLSAQDRMLAEGQWAAPGADVERSPDAIAQDVQGRIAAGIPSRPWPSVPTTETAGSERGFSPMPPIPAQAFPATAPPAPTPQPPPPPNMQGYTQEPPPAGLARPVNAPYGTAFTRTGLGSPGSLGAWKSTPTTEGIERRNAEIAAEKARQQAKADAAKPKALDKLAARYDKLSEQANAIDLGTTGGRAKARQLAGDAKKAAGNMLTTMTKDMRTIKDPDAVDDYVRQATEDYGQRLGEGFAADLMKRADSHKKDLDRASGWTELSKARDKYEAQHVDVLAAHTARIGRRSGEIYREASKAADKGMGDPVSWEQAERQALEELRGADFASLSEVLPPKTLVDALVRAKVPRPDAERIAAQALEPRAMPGDRAQAWGIIEGAVRRGQYDPSTIARMDATEAERSAAAAGAAGEVLGNAASAYERAFPWYKSGKAGKSVQPARAQGQDPRIAELTDLARKGSQTARATLEQRGIKWQE